MVNEPAYLYWDKIKYSPRIPKNIPPVAFWQFVKEIRKYMGANSLKYLRLESLIKASEQDPNSVCTACFSGKYAMKVNMQFKKNILENNC